MYRLNTYPFSHLGFIHTILNVLALTQLLERFEAEHGTLVTLILFTGRTFPSPSTNLSLQTNTPTQPSRPSPALSTSSSSASSSAPTPPPAAAAPAPRR